MTMTERKRACLFMKVSDTYGGTARLRLTLPLFVCLQLLITIVAYSAEMGEGNYYEIPSLFGVCSFMTYLAMIFQDMFLGDGGKLIAGNMSGFTCADTTGKFLCTLPFKAGDLINARIIRWEWCSAANILLYAANQIIAVLLEGAGYTMYHSYTGISFIISVLMSVWFLVAALLRGVKKSFIWGVCFAIFYFIPIDFLTSFDDDIEAIARLDETAPVLGAFYGISGIFLYAAAMAVIGVTAELVIKKRSDKSWCMK